jgi:hypothetical protein
MSVLNMPSSRPSHETELEGITQLAVTLSGQLARVHVDDITKAIVEALQRVAAVTHVDSCQLIEFSEIGAVARAHVPTPAVSTDGQLPHVPASEEGLVTRLAGGDVVSISRPEELPIGAMAARLLTRQSGVISLLGVRATSGAQSDYAESTHDPSASSRTRIDVRVHRRGTWLAPERCHCFQETFLSTTARGCT